MISSAVSVRDRLARVTSQFPPQPGDLGLLRTRTPDRHPGRLPRQQAVVGPAAVWRMDLAEASVAQVARSVVGDQGAALVRWAVEPLAGGVTGEVGLGGSPRRVAGVAAIGGERRDWSAVVKVLRRGEVRVGELSGTLEDERGFDYWRREADAYGSGLLEGLPDALMAPRCYRVDDAGRGRIEVWLEDLPDQGPRPGRCSGSGWPLAISGSLPAAT